MAKISICIPTYNNLSDVGRLFCSIACQDYTDYEVIVTDDSTDRAIEEYICAVRDDEADPLHDVLADKLQYLHNEKPLGHIYNWNKALSLAQGEYVKIMFSDDWFGREDSLRKMASLLDDHAGASLAFCGTRQMLIGDDRAELIRERAASGEFVERLKADYRSLFLGNEIGAPSAVIYRHGEYRFDEKSNWASDMFLYFEILRVNPVFAWTDETLINIGEHEEQYTHSFREKDGRKYEDYRYMYEKYGLADSAACREYLLTNFLVPYGKGVAEAAVCGIDHAAYRRERRRYLWNNKVRSYWKAGIGKIRGLLK